MPDCPRFNKWVRGCNFVARYDYGAPTIKRTAPPIVDTISEQIEASKPRTYVRDVCTSCGKTVERN